MSARRVPDDDPRRLQLEVRAPDGLTQRFRLPDDYLDRVAACLSVDELVAWLGVDPDASEPSRRDGAGALLALARRRAETTVRLPVLEPGVVVGGLRSTRPTLGVDPGWAPYPWLAVGRWTDEGVIPAELLGEPVEEPWLASVVEVPPPSPKPQDPDSWPDTVADWLLDLDARLRVSPDLTAADYRALYIGYDYIEDPHQAQDPAMEEALRIRQVPGALPPPEPLPPARAPTEAAGSAGEVADLPVVPIDNRVAIVDRPGADQLEAPFLGSAGAVRRLWDDALAAGDDASAPGLDPDDAPRWLGGVPRWAMVGLGLFALAVAVLLVFFGLFGSDDDGDVADTKEETGAAVADGMAVDDYADQVCTVLAEQVRGPSDAFGAAMDSFQGATPATVEEAQQLYDDLASGAAAFAGALAGAADALADGEAPAVAGGAEAHAAAIETYRSAAAALDQIATLAGDFDATTAQPADSQAFAAAMAPLLRDLGALGGEYAAAPEVQAALDASAVCVEAEAATGN